eukprot:1143379-Pelagomonas_calceolata.AAC.1
MSALSPLHHANRLKPDHLCPCNCVAVPTGLRECLPLHLCTTPTGLRTITSAPAHVLPCQQVCASWVPEVGFGGADVVETIEGVQYVMPEAGFGGAGVVQTIEGVQYVSEACFVWPFSAKCPLQTYKKAWVEGIRHTHMHAGEQSTPGPNLQHLPPALRCPHPVCWWKAVHGGFPPPVCPQCGAANGCLAGGELPLTAVEAPIHQKE